MNKRLFRAAGAFLLLFSMTAFALAGERVMTEITGVLYREIHIKDGYPDNPVITGESSTTGLPFSGTYVPILAVLDNSLEALPQWGIRDADILYQMPNGGVGSTKICALFADKVPAKAGGIRSARVPFVDLRESWDAVFVHRGMPPSNVQDKARVDLLLRKYGIRSRHLDFDIGESVKNFGQREKYHGAPHNLSAYLADIKAAVIETGYMFVERPFLFSDKLPDTASPAKYIEIAHYGETTGKDIGNPSSWASYTYDEGSRTYSRATVEGPYADIGSRETAFTFSNVIVQRTDFSYAQSYVVLNDVVGTGAADIFMGGRYIAGGWYRENIGSRTVFLDANGSEIALMRGKSFIIVTNDVTRVRYSGE